MQSLAFSLLIPDSTVLKKCGIQDYQEFVLAADGYTDLAISHLLNTLQKGFRDVLEGRLKFLVWQSVPFKSPFSTTEAQWSMTFFREQTKNSMIFFSHYWIQIALPKPFS